MIDIHSHILPHFDDGAPTTEIALEMLRESKRQGVDRVVSTSHCYPRRESSINDFIYDRTERLLHMRRVTEECGEPMPMLYAGCELNLCRDISDDPHLHELCIEGTDYLLLEMPYDAWGEWCFEAVYKIGLRGIRPVIAHIDRFLYQKQSALDALFEQDVLYQVNAEAFLDRRMNKKLDTLIRTGKAHFIGSDMHNTENRAPNLGAARERIIKNFGSDYWEYFEKNNRCLLKNEEIDGSSCKKLVRKSFFYGFLGKNLKKT
jgi:protein-tyrosine phosphatase